MVKLTKNLFYSSGEGEYKLDVTEGSWPDDMEGAAYIIAPDKEEAGGHWLAHHGIIFKIDCSKSTDNKVKVVAKRVNNRANRLREKWPKLFGTMSALEMSPLGVSNLANTNLQFLDGRLFVGYDIGRPVEVDALTLDYITPVGSNSEWIHGMPSFIEPQVSVAAHPAPDYEKNDLYFVNYNIIPDNKGIKNTTINQWDMEGKVKSWPIKNMPAFDTIHDIKSTRNYLIFTDLPLIVEPRTEFGKPRRHANQEIAQVWIIAKETLAKTKPGQEIDATFVKLDSPVGHIKADVNDDDDKITVYFQHIPATDLNLIVKDGENSVTGEPYPSDYEGFISVGPQPNMFGKYTIDAKTGEILNSKMLWDKNQHWNSLLATENIYSAESREQSKHIWTTCMGFEPDLTMAEAYRLYKDSKCAVVPLDELPKEEVPPSICHINLESMEYDDAYFFEPGTFAHPPTFIPRKNSKSEDDGYILAFLNKDKPKEVVLFDAADLAKGPVARASGDGFNPPVTLHSTWTSNQTRKSQYKVGFVSDFVGAILSLPKASYLMFKNGRNMTRRFSVE